MPTPVAEAPIDWGAACLPATLSRDHADPDLACRTAQTDRSLEIIARL
jgi:hypothetical protein